MIFGTISDGKALSPTYLGLDIEDQEGLQECYFLVTEILNPTDEKMESLFKELPASIKNEILMWGSYETCTRKKICTWLIKNIVSE